MFLSEFDRSVLAALRASTSAETIGALASGLDALGWEPSKITPARLASVLIRLEELGLVRNEICFVALAAPGDD